MIGLGVVGTGQMGAGIAQTAVVHGFSVAMADQDRGRALDAREQIAARLSAQVAKGKLAPEALGLAMERLTVVEGLEGLAGAGMVVEAVTEDPSTKFALFRSLDAICPPETVLASNTSSISVTAIGAQTRRPDQVAGMHFMHPVPVMKLVEGVRGLATSDATFALVRQVAEAMGKTFVESRDVPGFIVNRILMPMINEAIFALQEGLATAADIDAAMVLGTNQPMGPLALADFIGLDTVLGILEVMHQGHGDPKFRPCPLLRTYVAAGRLGRKTGRGLVT